MAAAHDPDSDELPPIGAIGKVEAKRDYLHQCLDIVLLSNNTDGVIIYEKMKK
jgi:hypothetical protein